MMYQNQQLPPQVQMVMSEQAIATDLLLTAKTAVRNCAYAVTETTTPSVRKVVNQQLQQAVAFHEKVANYMINKGYYQPYDMQQQAMMDQQVAQTAMYNSMAMGNASSVMGTGGSATGSMEMMTNPSAMNYPSSYTTGSTMGGGSYYYSGGGQSAGSSKPGAGSSYQNYNAGSTFGGGSSYSSDTTGTTSAADYYTGSGSTTGSYSNSNGSSSSTSSSQYSSGSTSSGSGTSSSSNQQSGSSLTMSISDEGTTSITTGSSASNIDINIDADDDFEDYNIYDDDK